MLKKTPAVFAVMVITSLVGCAPRDGAAGSGAGDGGSPSQAAIGGFTLRPPPAAFQNLLGGNAGAPPQIVMVDGKPRTLGALPPAVDVPQDGALIPYTIPPASYDLRGLGKLSNVRDQGACGSCWTFGSYASAESALLPNDPQDLAEEHQNNAHGFDIPACQGGNATMTIAYLSRWSGAVAETDAPYTATVHAYPGPLPLRKHLEEAVTIPDRTGPADNTLIKNAVTNYGAVATTMAWVSSCWNGGTSSFYNAGSGNTNHLVAIVGWDDSYPAANFASHPAGNGAFLVRNSWGVNFGTQGYFWISYYDKFIGLGNNVYDVMAPTTDYRDMYQYDSFGYTAAASIASNTLYAANVFTGTADATLQGVSFYTTTPNTTVDVSIYDAPVDVPTSGALVGTVHGGEAYGGYHTLSVATLNAQVQKGRRFAVVVRMQGAAATSYVAVEYPWNGFSSKVKLQPGMTFLSSDGAAWSDATKQLGANVPIKAFAGGPQCDDGNACTDDSFDGAQCVHMPSAAGTVCRPSQGACDLGASCDGSGAACPASAVAPAGTMCRAAAGPCDVAESCDGKSPACPNNGFVPAATVCRAATGGCDVAEVCTGSSASCPNDAVKAVGTVCRPASSLCDVAEVCSGKSGDCPVDAFKAAGTVCRAANGACDVAETCSGMSATCAADYFQKAGTVCRPSAGACDVAEVCSGTSSGCPVDAFAVGTICRPPAGACDTAEMCSGKSAACPADAFRAVGFVCRTSAGPCDAVEACSGKSAACPADAMVAAGTVCRAKAGACDAAETCSGKTADCPADKPAAAGTVCRTAAGACDAAEACDGIAKVCPADAMLSAGTVCRPVAGACDVAESCSGKSISCPADSFVAVNTVCRPAAGGCDIAESCTGKAAACPRDALRPKGFICQPPNIACTGASPVCM